MRCVENRAVWISNFCTMRDVWIASEKHTVYHVHENIDSPCVFEF